ncbi:unnamed protein product [Brachionus calyciflorus]|uniref:EF-hand domain-containing protein n=1 Tax=Brachionus calyciflorus TaxID=104777 RepID=A0A813M2U0_9BILA|nr:unnamed protein product [Brachionus calyciflorus]
MGSSSSKFEHSQCLKNKLRKLPFEPPTERDYDFLAYQTGMVKSQIREIFEKFLENHPDGRMNRSEFCQLYLELRKEAPEIILGLSENVFRALGIKDLEADLVSLREFFITYALTSRGDIRKKLEYAFEVYDTNRDNALDLDEVREAVYGVLELFETPKDVSIADIAKDCIKNVKITCVVKKDDFIEEEIINKITIKARQNSSLTKSRFKNKFIIIKI